MVQVIIKKKHQTYTPLPLKQKGLIYSNVCLSFLLLKFFGATQQKILALSGGLGVWDCGPSAHHFGPLAHFQCSRVKKS